MSKNRLLQIVNRLELNPKDKNDLINIINTNTDKVEKLLENVPEGLDTLKEIANTPADFLNNNNELGGMINMPFGFKNIELNNKLVYNHKGDNIQDVDCGILENWYYGKVLVITSVEGNIPILEMFNINDITGKNNEKQIANDNIYIYYLDRHIYISSTGYTPATFTFVSFTDNTKLPLSFTTPYIVGNDTQERLYEFKKLCSNNYYGNIPMMIINSKFGIQHLTNITFGGPPMFLVLEGLNSDGNKVTIKFPSKDISALEVGQNVEDIGATTTIKPLVTIPDWNANEDEEGYIKNRTHYAKKVNLVTVSKENITSEPYDVGNMYAELYYREENKEEYYVELKYQANPNTENLEWTSIGQNGPPLKIAINFGRLYIKNPSGYSRNNFTFWNEDIRQLNEKFIDNKIARAYNYELSHIKLDISETDSNVTTLNDNSISLIDRCVCDLYDYIYNKENALIHNGELYNGVITGIKEGKLVQYDVNFETGEITLKRTTDLELIGSEVKLDVCTAGSTEAARNLELLNKAYFALGDHFTVNIDAGIGVAKFIPETGGEGHITTAAGVNVHYTIGNDGSVVKTQEIDIVALYNKVEAISTNE